MEMLWKFNEAFNWKTARTTRLEECIKTHAICIAWKLIAPMPA